MTDTATSEYAPPLNETTRLALSWRPDGKLHVHVLNVEGMPVFVQTLGGRQILIGGSNSPSALLSALGARMPGRIGGKAPQSPILFLTSKRLTYDLAYARVHLRHMLECIYDIQPRASTLRTSHRYEALSTVFRGPFDAFLPQGRYCFDHGELFLWKGYASIRLDELAPLRWSEDDQAAC